MCIRKPRTDTLTQRLTARNSPAPERQRSASAQPDEQDARSPLERFRSKKPLSVTDLVSPAWCELQYFYSLSKYGRVRKTVAMKKGSEVHKVLEEQVHTTVPVETVSKEDTFGLRLWNIIQGLRTLRVTGMTRELEVWGVVEGQVVNGIIDELSFTCPDEELQTKIQERQSAGGKGSKKKQKLSPSQKTMDTFLSLGKGADEEVAQSNTDLQRQVYLTDIKTRGSRSLPTEPAFRGTAMQLMLYHRLLSLLTLNSVPADQIFARYGLDSSAAFSDTFIAQIAGLEFNFREDAAQSDLAPFESSQDGLEELLAHNTLKKLWTLVISEFQRTLPFSPAASDSQRLHGGVSSPIGDVLRAEFRAPGSGDIIGSKTFAFDAEALNAWIMQEMAWWCGERPARGVDIEEAYKCRICEFAEICSWRKDKVEEGLRKARLRKEARKKSEV